MKLIADYRQQFKASQGLDRGGKQNTANQMLAVTSNFARFTWHDCKYPAFSSNFSRQRIAIAV